MSLRKGSAALGLALTGIGGLALSLALMRSPLFPEAVVGASGHALGSGAGLGILVAGVILTIFSFRPSIEQAPIVPAHVAFASRTPRPIDMPERVCLPTPRAASSRAPADEAAVSRLDDEIRDLTRQISKAGVMLATGQISHQGYASYVSELKKRRGDLEASRVRIELQKA